MGRLAQRLIPVRFVMTMGHILVLATLSYTMEDNVRSSLKVDNTQAEYDDTKNSMMIWWYIGMACFVFDFMGMFMGFSIFFSSINLTQVILHFVGGIWVSNVIIFEWTVDAFQTVVLVTNLLPALAEICAILYIFVLRG
jgi:hypothetical protein